MVKNPSVESAEGAGLPPAIACLARHGVAVETLRRAAAIAERTGTEPVDALLAHNLADEETVYRAFAAEVGLPFLADLRVHAMARFPQAVLTGVVPLAIDSGGRAFAVAPRGAEVARMIANAGSLSSRLAVTTPTHLRDALIAARAAAIADRAADGLARDRPDESARTGATPGQSLGLTLILLTVCGALAGWPGAAWPMACLCLGLGFLGVAVLRLAALCEAIAPDAPPGLPRSAEADLPVYTILIPLNREAKVVERLLAGLRALDYPAAKKDVKLLIEADDHETARALAEADRPGFVEVITVPAGAPRTKPRALNVGLALARGEFVTVYDAEDVPDPGQLRLAVATFARAPPDVACLQARLVIDNTADTLITRLFTIDYAALFDVLNPALARFDLPIPLGGTSNHIRAGILREVGGWDAWNVTEDADLGVRLSRAGHRIADLPSATLEEAPRAPRAWVRQRRRWMKGLLQVALTHSRDPVTVLRQLGPTRFLGAVALTLGTVGSALGYPVFFLLALGEIASGRLLGATSPAEIGLASLGATVFLAGIGAMILPPLEALRRRRWWGLMVLVPLMPVYYAFVSWAAWRAVADLLVDPHVWLKTEHGLARTSRFQPDAGWASMTIRSREAAAGPHHRG